MNRTTHINAVKQIIVQEAARVGHKPGGLGQYEKHLRVLWKSFQERQQPDGAQKKSHRGETLQMLAV